MWEVPVYIQITFSKLCETTINLLHFQAERYCQSYHVHHMLVIFNYTCMYVMT